MKKFLLASLLLFPFFGVQGQNLFDGVTISSNLTVQAGATVSGVSVVSNGVNGLLVTGANVGVSTNGATSGQVITFVGGTNVAFATAAGGSGMASNVVNIATASQNLAANVTNTYNGFINLSIASSAGGNILRNGLPYFGSSGATSNLFWGYNAGNPGTATSNPNIAIGTSTATNALTGTGLNITIGNRAGEALTSGNQNIYMGHLAGLSTLGGSQNIGIASQTLQNLSSGNYNIAIGNQALTSFSTSSRSVGIGIGAGGGADNSDATYIGYNAGGLMGGNGAGTSSIFLGAYAGGLSPQSANPTNTVVIGYGAYSLTHNAFILGNPSHNIGMFTNNPAVKQHFAGAQTIIGPQGTAYRSDISATAVLNFSTVLALGTSQALTVSVTGANTNDVVEPGPPIDFTTALADSTFNYHVSAVDTVTVTRTGLAATAVYTNKTWRMTIKHY